MASNSLVTSNWFAQRLDDENRQLANGPTVPRVFHQQSSYSVDAAEMITPALTLAQLEAIPDELINELGRFGGDLQRGQLVYESYLDFDKDLNVFKVTNQHTGKVYKRYVLRSSDLTISQREKMQRFYGADALWHFRNRK